MAKRAIRWSDRAKKELWDVLSFYNERNENIDFSLKVLSNINHLLKLIQLYPFLGEKTDDKITRVIAWRNFQLFYRAEEDIIKVMSFWDGRQNPNKRVDKK